MALRLWCFKHQAAHVIRAGDVERILYALGGMVQDVRMERDLARTMVAESSPPPDADYTSECPLVVLDSTHDIDGFFELVLDGVEGRETAGLLVTIVRPDWVV